MKFESCPRCNGNWESTFVSYKEEKFPFYRCNSCNIHYFDNREEVALRGILKPQTNLVWYCNENYCRYGSMEDVVNDSTLRLPWLPFTISKDRLKLILLFS